MPNAKPCFHKKDPSNPDDWYYDPRRKRPPRCAACIRERTKERYRAGKEKAARPRERDQFEAANHNDGVGRTPDELCEMVLGSMAAHIAKELAECTYAPEGTECEVVILLREVSGLVLRVRAEIAAETAEAQAVWEQGAPPSESR
jgi:hypothetical protein